MILLELLKNIKWYYINNFFKESEIESELKSAIEKFGPLQYHDYEYNYRYQTEKRILEHKKQFLNSNQLLH